VHLPSDEYENVYRAWFDTHAQARRAGWVDSGRSCLYVPALADGCHDSSACIAYLHISAVLTFSSSDGLRVTHIQSICHLMRRLVCQAGGVFLVT